MSDQKVKITHQVPTPAPLLGLLPTCQVPPQLSSSGAHSQEAFPEAHLFQHPASCTYPTTKLLGPSPRAWLVGHTGLKVWFAGYSSTGWPDQAVPMVLCGAAETSQNSAVSFSPGNDPDFHALPRLTVQTQPLEYWDSDLSKSNDTVCREPNNMKTYETKGLRARGQSRDPPPCLLSDQARHSSHKGLFPEHL